MRIQSGANFFASGEKRDDLGRYFDGIAGFGIAPLTRTPGATAKAAKSAQLHFVTLLEGLYNGGEEQIENLSRLLLCHLGFRSNLSHEFGFGHGFHLRLIKTLSVLSLRIALTLSAHHIRDLHAG
jgi:hypothetical protein